MPRLSPRAIAALTILSGLSIWITWRAKAIELKLSQSDEAADALNGKPAPDFHLPSLDGGTISPADFLGKKALVVGFWASWCGPCQEELPQLAAFYNRTRKRGSDYEMVAISIDDDPAAARKAAADMKLPFPVLLDPGGHISRQYRVSAIPELFLISKEGRVYHVKVDDSISVGLTLDQYLGTKLYGRPGAADGGSH